MTFTPEDKQIEAPTDLFCYVQEQIDDSQHRFRSVKEIQKLFNIENGTVSMQGMGYKNPCVGWA